MRHFVQTIGAVVSMVLLAWYSFHRNSMATLFIGALLLVFFLAVLLRFLARAWQEKSVTAHLPLLLLGVAGVGVTLGLIHHVDQDLRELDQARRQTLRELRPVLLNFKEDMGRYPRTLEDLVPGYLDEIPRALRSAPGDPSGREIDYWRTEKDAVFRYHTSRGPDSSVFYSVAGDGFTYQH